MPEALRSSDWRSRRGVRSRQRPPTGCPDYPGPELATLVVSLVRQPVRTPRLIFGFGGRTLPTRYNGWWNWTDSWRPLQVSAQRLGEIARTPLGRTCTKPRAESPNLPPAR